MHGENLKLMNNETWGSVP